MLFLVTGNAGFIASNLVDYLINRGHNVIGIDALLEGSCVRNINSKILQWWTFPLHETKWQCIESSYLPDYIIHTAALSNVDTSIKSPQLFNWNYLATSNVLEWAREWKIPILYASTDEVYGTYKPYVEPWEENGFTEQSRLEPSNPYAASKAACDLLAISYHTTWGADVRITRCSNNFGIRQQDKLIPTILKKHFRGEKIPIFETPAMRDWLHVEDHCSAIMTVIEKGRPGEIYNISANAEKSPQEVVKLFGLQDEMVLIPSRPGYDLRYFVNSDKIKSLGWKPARTLENSIDELTGWYEKAFKEAYFD
jgi:dTDP-glucose 4,6-dehydratase